MASTIVGSGFEDGDGDDEEWEKVFLEINQAGQGQARQDEEIQGQPQLEPVRTHTFRDVPIRFPGQYEAYKAQTQLMEKIIDGVMTGENCLLESPTGTGKTAALLCSLLGWQQYLKQPDLRSTSFQTIQAEASKNAGGCVCEFIKDSEGPVSTPIIQKMSKNKFTITGEFLEEMTMENSVNNQDNEDPNPPKRKKTEPKLPNTTMRTVKKENLCRSCILKYFQKFGTPKIFYATRTHTQIAQVVEQLKNTPYKKAKMTILHSRANGCVNSDVLLQPRSAVIDSRCQVDDSCRELKKNYYFNKKLGFNGLSAHKKVCPQFQILRNSGNGFGYLQENGAWDIEDLKKYGKERDMCPYYGARDLLSRADIVFCPYNYLINPGIRRAFNYTEGFDLTGSVIVFDEAHNLESICRDAASFRVDLKRLDDVRKKLDKYVTDASKKKEPEEEQLEQIKAAERLSLLLQKLSSWMGKNAPKVNPYKPSSNNFIEVGIEALKEIGLGPCDIPELSELLHDLGADGDDADDDDEVGGPETDSTQKEKKLPSLIPWNVIELLQYLLEVLLCVYEEGNISQYTCILTNPEKEKIEVRNNDNTDSNNDTLNGVTPQKKEYFHNIRFEILCLSPAIAFRELKDNAHSIIVASGTLSPLESFAAELDTPFRVQLSADHVIQPHQSITLVVCRSPGDDPKTLIFNKDGQDDVELQDALGESILEICKSIPYGVLVFLPSYTFMNILKKRWCNSNLPASNSLLHRLEEVKHIFFEEQKSKDQFAKDMKQYKELIDSSSKGCILFAIFRGKVSEGVNFTDNQARAVICVGIPFASVVSAEVVCKKKYNNARLNASKEAAMSGGQPVELLSQLSGDQWYDIQAFRAMNQAFGRCIRHINDWGALILLDSRFVGNKKNQGHLSGWTKRNIEYHDNFQIVKCTLQKFVYQRMNNIPPSPKVNWPDSQASASQARQKTESGISPRCLDYGQTDDLRNPVLAPLPYPCHDVSTSQSQTDSSEGNACDLQDFLSDF